MRPKNDKICVCCKGKIFNKLRGSIYCKKCAKILRKVRDATYGWMAFYKRNHPEHNQYKISIKVNVIEKKYKEEK